MEESAAAAREALRLRPNFAEAAVNLGNAELKLDRVAEALDAYRLASSIRPDFPTALCGQALALRALDRLEEARAAFERAERLGSVEAISGKGCLDLTLGDFERGWEGYEARWIAGKSLDEALGVRFPKWRGPGRTGERVLVLNDHGLGDTIQFARYLEMMARAGAAPTFLCPSKMHRLLSSLSRVRLVEKAPDGESFDAQIAVSSLPRAFATRLDSVPANVAYLRAEPELAEKWAARIGPAGVKIGIVWQGNPNAEADMARSMPLKAFAPLAAAPGARLISLQKGFGVEQLADLPPGLRVETLGEDFDAGPDAFVDAAAAIDAPRPRRHLRHRDRPSGGRARPAGVGRPEKGRGMAVAARSRRFAMVSDDAAVSPEAARRLERRFRSDGRAPRLARRGSAAPGG